MSFETIRCGLTDVHSAHAFLMHAWNAIKPALLNGDHLHVEIRAEKRSDPQNRKLHACLDDISSQLQWAGKKRNSDTWKRLVTAGWLRARGESIEILPAIDGHGIDVVFRRTSDLTISECSELLEYVLAWGTTNGVLWSHDDNGGNACSTISHQSTPSRSSKRQTLKPQR